MSQEFGAKFIEIVMRDLKKRVNDRKARIAKNIHNGLTVATPVDTGQARAGWNIAKNERDTRVPKRPTDGKRLPRPPSTLGGGKAPKEFGDTLNITNAVPHITALNEGNSVQAPSNFVEREIIRGKRTAEGK